MNRAQEHYLGDDYAVVLTRTTDYSITFTCDILPHVTFSLPIFLSWPTTAPALFNKARTTKRVFNSHSSPFLDSTLSSFLEGLFRIWGLFHTFSYKWHGPLPSAFISSPCNSFSVCTNRPNTFQFLTINFFQLLFVWFFFFDLEMSSITVQAFCLMGFFFLALLHMGHAQSMAPSPLADAPMSDGKSFVFWRHLSSLMKLYVHDSIPIVLSWI